MKKQKEIVYDQTIEEIDAMLSNLRSYLKMNTPQSFKDDLNDSIDFWEKQLAIQKGNKK